MHEYRFIGDSIEFEMQEKNAVFPCDSVIPVEQRRCFLVSDEDPSSLGFSLLRVDGCLRWEGGVGGAGELLVNDIRIRFSRARMGMRRR